MVQSNIIHLQGENFNARVLSYIELNYLLRLKMSHLTEFAITMINDGNLQLQPCLQVVDIVELGLNHKATPRYRMDLSDGVFKQRATIPKKYNDYVGSGEIVKGSIVLLKGYNYPAICKSRYAILKSYPVIYSYEYKNICTSNLIL